MVAGINLDRLSLFPKALQQLASRKPALNSAAAAQPISPKKAPNSSKRTAPAQHFYQERGPSQAGQSVSLQPQQAQPNLANKGQEGQAPDTKHLPRQVEGNALSMLPQPPISTLGADAQLANGSTNLGTTVDEPPANEAGGSKANGEQVLGDDQVQQDLMHRGLGALQDAAALPSPLDGQLVDEPPAVEQESELRNPASPGCVYSGLQLELSPADDGAVNSLLRENLDELRDIAQASEQPGLIEHDPSVQAEQHPDEAMHKEMEGSAMGRQHFDGQEQGTAPIQTLPPASQIDPSVMDALPLQMKREIEQAYGKPGCATCQNSDQDARICQSF